jgi:hypothetical protein
VHYLRVTPNDFKPSFSALITAEVRCGWFRRFRRDGLPGRSHRVRGLCGNLRRRF